MIDNITIKAPLIDSFINDVIDKNNLKEIKKEGKTTEFNNNMNKKALNIKIDMIEQKIILKGSLHKYYNYLLTNDFENHSTSFNWSEALQCFDMIEAETRINLQNASIKRIEFGVNLYTNEAPKNFIELMQSIKNKELIENPKYKKLNEIVTCMHRDYKKFYKIYNKTAELMDKRKHTEKNILRCETVWQQPENLTVKKIIDPAFINSITNEFSKTWNSLIFEKQIILPPKTKTGRIETTKLLLKFTEKEVIEMYRKKLKNNELTEKQFRGIREFIEQDWQNFKPQVSIQKNRLETDFFNLLNDSILKINNLQKSDLYNSALFGRMQKHCKSEN